MHRATRPRNTALRSTRSLQLTWTAQRITHLGSSTRAATCLPWMASQARVQCCNCNKHGMQHQRPKRLRQTHTKGHLAAASSLPAGSLQTPAGLVGPVLPAQCSSPWAGLRWQGSRTERSHGVEAARRTGPRPGSHRADTGSVAPQVWQRMLCSAGHPFFSVASLLPQFDCVGPAVPAQCRASTPNAEPSLRLPRGR